MISDRTADARMTRHLVQQGALRGAELGMVDVGASGGIDKRWSVFGDQLRAWGFDPLEGEVDRLNALRQPNVSYHACWVGYKGYQSLVERVPYPIPERPAISNDPGSRLSLWKALTLAEAENHYDGSGAHRQTERRIELDEFFTGAERARVDFVKTDTDGSDYQVLLGAAGLLKESPVLGVQAECVFHGQLHPHVQAFGNLDRLMRESGFSLFEMDTYRYSRSALPSLFVWGSPGPTVKGQLWWGDFLYFRDLGDPAYEANWGFEPSTAKILKLACCYETFDLADAAAEVLLKYRARLAASVDVDRCLDLLVPAEFGVSYRQYLARFEKDPKSFRVGLANPKC